MALDHLTISGRILLLSAVLYWSFSLATSVEVEWTFSQGRLILSHVCSRLSVQSTHALMCLSVWSLLGYVGDADCKAAAVLPAVIGEEEELANDWDDLTNDWDTSELQSASCIILLITKPWAIALWAFVCAKPVRTCTRTCQNTYPWVWVWVSVGTGTGTTWNTLGLPVAISSSDWHASGKREFPFAALDCFLAFFCFFLPFEV
jgi:hypothetical protein